MSSRIRFGRMEVAANLHDFIDREVLPGLGFEAASFWGGLEKFLADLAPRNRALLEKRDALQARIDAWHRERRGKVRRGGLRRFLPEIGYLVPRGADFAVDTAHVDPEIAAIAGPQLVVPVSNARYALNAANARWGSLYDALYGTTRFRAPPDAVEARATTRRAARW